MIRAALLLRLAAPLPNDAQLMDAARKFRAAAAPRSVRMQVCASLDGAHAYVYLRGDASLLATAPSGPADCVRLEPIVEQASANGDAAAYHYVVATDVEAGWEADFNAWYAEEHLPGLAAVPGCVRAQRYRSLDAGPRYHACYDLVSPLVLESPPWLAVRHTDWSSRVRPHFTNTRRIMFRVLADDV